MSVKKTIARSFTVETIEDGISVQAQYAPNANPTSSQIHNVWQDGDLFMRTRETDSTTWSAWHRIVGENGGETDYSFGISQYRTTENAQTAPSDISSWSDAPLAVTTAKPYLWSKVQQKSWNESTQQYVVDSTRYIRLTGEEGVVYDIQTPVDSIHIGENQTSATLSGTAKFYKKEGTKDKVQTVFYYGVYKRTGTTFTKVATGNANSYAFSNLAVANTVNAVVIYLFASSYTGTDPESQTYLCKREMLVVDAGNSPYFADLDNEMDSIACANDGKPSSEQTVETNVKLYRGSTALSPTLAVNDDSPSGAAYTSGTAKDGITVTWNNTTGNIKFKFGTSNSRTKTETFCITLTVTDNGATITRYLYFTVNCIRAALDGNPAALYRLVPSVNEIVKKKDGTYTPTGTSYITCGVTKNVGGTQSTPAASEYTLKYSLNGGAETAYTATSVRANQVTSNLVFILYVNGIVVDRETIGLVTDGIDGTSPYFADLDNEMDSIACTHDGKAASAQSVVTHVSMFKGSSAEAFTVDKIYRNGTQMSWDGNNNGVWPRFSGGTVTLEFDSGAAVNIKDDFKITLYATNATSVTRELHFIVNGIRANAIYRLVPSHSQIVKKKDGTYVPSGNVTCSVEKTENGSTSTPSSSEYTLEKSVNGGSYTTYSATAASSITSDLKFRLTVGGVVVDLETIPLVSDGDKGNTGDSAPNAFANPAQISIPCYSNGNVKAQKITSVIFSLKVGTHTATVTSCADGTKPTGVTVQGQANNAVTITVGTSATASGLSAGVTFTVTGTYDGKTYSATVTVALIGSTQGEQGDPGSPGGTGPRGKIGRFFYYAGEWNDFASTDSFLVNDAQAPYFYYDNNYWVFNPETNGTYTKQNMGTPSSSSSNWKLMTSDFKYIITEAIFGNYAHFGSAIINGDWLLSTNGKIGITDYNNGSSISGTLIGGSSFSTIAYTLFDPQNPLGKDSTVKNGTTDVTIAASETAHTLGTVDLVSGTTYQITCKGKRNGSTAIYVRVRNNSYGTGQLIYYPSTTEGEYRAFFRVTTSATYTVEMYQPTTGGGGVTSMWSIDKVVFSPNYAVDLLTGAVIQYESYMQGFIKKARTIINSSNINKYAYKSIFDDMVLDFDKCGNFIELQYQGSIYFALPMLSSYLAPKYTEDQKTQIRSFIGSNMIVYNKTGSNLTIVYKILETSTYATTVGNNGFIELECHTDIDTNSKEVVFWEIVKQGTMV